MNPTPLGSRNGTSRLSALGPFSGNESFHRTTGVADPSRTFRIAAESDAIAVYQNDARLASYQSEGERLYTPRDLDADIGTGGPPTDVVIPSYGAGAMVLEKIARSAAVEALLTRSFNHYKNPERAFRLSTELARRVEVWDLVLGDPLETASFLHDLLG